MINPENRLIQAIPPGVILFQNMLMPVVKISHQLAEPSITPATRIAAER